MNNKEEAKLEVQIDKYREVIKKHIEDDCNIKGFQKSNLTKEEMRGIQKIKKRVQDGELIVYGTDKTNRMAVTTSELYYKM